MTNFDEFAVFVNGIEVGFGLSMLVYFLGQGVRIFCGIVESAFGRVQY